MRLVKKKEMNLTGTIKNMVSGSTGMEMGN